MIRHIFARRRRRTRSRINPIHAREVPNSALDSGEVQPSDRTMVPFDSIYRSLHLVIQLGKRNPMLFVGRIEIEDRDRSLEVVVAEQFHVCRRKSRHEIIGEADVVCHVGGCGEEIGIICCHAGHVVQVGEGADGLGGGVCGRGFAGVVLGCVRWIRCGCLGPAHLCAAAECDVEWMLSVRAGEIG